MEAMFFVGTDLVKDPICGKSTLKHGLNHCGTRYCEESELLFDLKNKHLKYIGNHSEQIKPTTLNKACKGKTTSIYPVYGFYIQPCII